MIAMRRLPGWLAAASLATTCFAQPARADDYPYSAVALPATVKLDPIAPWNLDLAENRCRLTGLFGSTEEPHLLVFEQAAPRAAFGMTFAGPEVRAFAKSSRIELGAERDELMRKINSHGWGDVAQIGPAIFLSSLDIGRFGDDPEAEKEDGGSSAEDLRSAGIDLEEAATIERFVLKRGKRVLSFETGNMGPPFQALNVCTLDLLRSWGLDPEKHAAYRLPRWVNQRVIEKRIQNAYPSAALERGEQGIFRMRVIVEADGSVSDCHLEESTVTDSLVSPACREMLGARFEPARDAEGAPMRSFYATTISYSIY